MPLLPQRAIQTAGRVAMNRVGASRNGDLQIAVVFSFGGL